MAKKEKKFRDEARFSKPLFHNFDYTDEGPNETSPGGGLYHGKMDKFKSTRDFIEKRRKQNKRVEALEELNKVKK